MKFISIILTCLLSFSAIAQEEEIYSTQYEFKAGSTAYLFGDNVKFREGPGTGSKTLATLKIGSEIVILAKSDSTYLYEGIEWPWYKVRHGNSVGYVLGGLISLERKTCSGDPDGESGVIRYRKEYGEPVDEVINWSESTITECDLEWKDGKLVPDVKKLVRPE